MNMTFKPFASKPWFVTDTEICYNGKTIPIALLDSFSLLTTPATALTAGLIGAEYNGEQLFLPFPYRQKSEAHQLVEFINNKIDEVHGVKKDYKYLLTSKTGTKLEVYNDYLIIYFMPTGSMFANIARGGNTGGKRINFRDITSIQFMEPAVASEGFMQFSYPGSAERKDGVIGALHDENSILISSSTLDLAREIYNYIEESRNHPELSAETIVQQTSAADEIKKFKELLDMGVITQEEFDEKKKQLLGL